MNTIKKLAISLTMSLLFCNLATANYTSYVKVEEGAVKRIYLKLENVSSNTSIRILDEEGFVLIEEEASAAQDFAKLFNLENLHAGHYTLILESEFKETVQPIIVTYDKLIVEDSKREEYFPAIILVEKQAVKLSLFNPTKSETAFSIIDRWGEVVYKDHLKGSNVVEKSYNVSQLPAGRYTVIVDNSRKAYSKVFDL